MCVWLSVAGLGRRFPAAAESSSQSQEGSQENLPYEHQHHQQYSGFGGGAFGTGSGTWGGGGGSEDAAASEGGEWTGDAIVLEPVNPWDDYNYGGSVAVHTRSASIPRCYCAQTFCGDNYNSSRPFAQTRRIQTSKTGQQFQFLAKCQNVDRWSGWETPELAEAAAAAARALSQPHVRQNQELTRDAVEEAAGEGGGAGGSQPIKVGGRSRMPSDEIDKFSDGAQAPNSFPRLGCQLFSFLGCAQKSVAKMEI